MEFHNFGQKNTVLAFVQMGRESRGVRENKHTPHSYQRTRRHDAAKVKEGRLRERRGKREREWRESDQM